MENEPMSEEERLSHLSPRVRAAMKAAGESVGVDVDAITARPTQADPHPEDANGSARPQSRPTVIDVDPSAASSPPAGRRWGSRTLPTDEGSGTPAADPPLAPLRPGGAYRPSPLPRVGPVTRVGPGRTPPDDEDMVRPSAGTRPHFAGPTPIAPVPGVVSITGARANGFAERVKSVVGWSRNVVVGTAVSIFRDYDPRGKSMKEYNLIVGSLLLGTAVNYGGMLFFENIMPGSDRIVKAAIVAGMNGVINLALGKRYYDQEAKIKRDYTGIDQKKRLDELWNKHFSAMNKTETALRNFTRGGIIGVIAEHLTGEVVSQSIHNVTSNLPHEAPTIGVTLPTEVHGPDTSGWHAPWESWQMPDISKWHPFGIGEEAAPSPAAAPAIAPNTQPTPGVVRVVPQPAPTGVEGAAVPGAAAVPANLPGPAEAGPSPTAVPFPTAEAAAATPDQAAFINELRAVTHNGVVSDKDFAEILGKHQMLQEQVSAGVGAHLNLTAKIPQSDLEAYANQVFKKQILESLNSGESLDSAMQKAGAIYNVSVENIAPDQIQPEIAVEITKEVPIDTIKEVVVPDHSSVGHLVESSGHQIDWTPAGAHYVDTVNVFQAEALLNHDSLSSYYNELTDKGFLGENPAAYLSIDEINRYADLARNGDQDAFKKLVEALHWFKAGDNFRVVTPDQLEKIKNILLAARKV